MKKTPRVDSYDPVIYPRVFWVAIGLEGLNKIFVFCDLHDAKKENPGTYDRLLEDYNNGKAGVLVTCPVVHKSSGKFGVLTIILEPTELVAGDEAHEAIHAADYIFEQLGMYTQDFSDGNEHYAYLVGWLAGCISKTIVNIKKEYDTRRESDDVEA